MSRGMDSKFGLALFTLWLGLPVGGALSQPPTEAPVIRSTQGVISVDGAVKPTGATGYYFDSQGHLKWVIDPASWSELRGITKLRLKTPVAIANAFSPVIRYPGLERIPSIPSGVSTFAVMDSTVGCIFATASGTPLETVPAGADLSVVSVAVADEFDLGITTFPGYYLAADFQIQPATGHPFERAACFTSHDVAKKVSGTGAVQMGAQSSSVPALKELACLFDVATKDGAPSPACAISEKLVSFTLPQEPENPPALSLQPGGALGSDRVLQGLAAQCDRDPECRRRVRECNRRTGAHPRIFCKKHPEDECC